MRSTFSVIHVLCLTFSIILMGNKADGTLNIITRSDWGALPPTQSLTSLGGRPVTIVLITQTNSVECNDSPSCLEIVRKKQNFDINLLGKLDINANFIIGGDGNVYEGRGWDYQSQEERAFDMKSIYISFIGDYSHTLPKQEQEDAILALLKLGVAEKKLSKKYKLLGLRQVTTTLKPGIHLQDVIKTWKHWVPIL